MQMDTCTTHSTDALERALAPFEECMYFPSIDWDHSWERQQILITNLCNAQKRGRAMIVAPTGLIDHAPWHFATIRKMLTERTALSKAREAALHTENPLPANAEYIEPRFRRGTNWLFARLTTLGDPALYSSLRRMRRKRLVVASYVNQLVEMYLNSADYTILDLAERRQANDQLTISMKRLEREWAGRVDLLVADNSISLSDYADDRARNQKMPGQLISQGFEPPAKPNEQHGKHVAAYLGNLHSAIDYLYFRRMVEMNPDWEFKLCGKIMDRDAYQLLEMNNVNYVGSISKNEIGSFLNDASIGLIPYVQTEWTAGVFPTKLFEYLSYHLPVVSTGIPEVRKFCDSKYVQICNEPIRLEVQAVDPEEMETYIAPHTWNARMQRYGEAIMRTVKWSEMGEAE